MSSHSIFFAVLVLGLMIEAALLSWTRILSVREGIRFVPLLARLARRVFRWACFVSVPIIFFSAYRFHWIQLGTDNSAMRLTETRLILCMLGGMLSLLAASGSLVLITANPRTAGPTPSNRNPTAGPDDSQTHLSERRTARDLVESERTCP